MKEGLPIRTKQQPALEKPTEGSKQSLGDFIVRNAVSVNLVSVALNSGLFVHNLNTGYTKTAIADGLMAGVSGAVVYLLDRSNQKNNTFLRKEIKNAQFRQNITEPK